MPANTNPIFTLSPDNGMVQISTANTNRDGTGTIATVLTAGANGTRIDRVVVQAAGTVTTGVVRLFLYDGANTRLYQEILVPATTPSTSLAAWSTTLYFPNGLVLGSGWLLKASTNNAETFNVFAHAGDY